MYGKSASAGGASMTPSSVACVCAVIEVMRVRLPAAAQLIAAREAGVRAGPPRAVEYAVLQVPVALIRAHPACRPPRLLLAGEAVATASDLWVLAGEYHPAESGERGVAWQRP